MAKRPPSGKNLGILEDPIDHEHDGCPVPKFPILYALHSGWQCSCGRAWRIERDLAPGSLESSGKTVKAWRRFPSADTAAPRFGERA